MNASNVHNARQLVLCEARSWLGTGFHHAAKLKGIGVDCAQLLIACYCDTGIVAPVEPEYYAPDWFRHQEGEAFEHWVKKRMRSTLAPMAGDLLLFRYGRALSHGAIYLGRHDLIHSFRGRGVVLDSFAKGTPLGARFERAYSPWWSA